MFHHSQRANHGNMEFADHKETVAATDKGSIPIIRLNRINCDQTSFTGTVLNFLKLTV